ncbi:MAG: ABC transporter permease [Blautia sp.]
MFSMTRYHILLNLREKTMVFWTLAFPLLLGCFFYFGIGGVDEASQFQEIPVAVVDTDENFTEFIEGVSGEFLDPVYGWDMDEALKKLEDGKIQGIFHSQDEEPALTLGESSLQGSILKALVDGYQQQTGILEDVQGRMEEEVEGQTPQAAQKIAAENAKVLEDLVDQVRSGEREEYVKEVSLGGREVSSVAPYYFALVAMGCLYMCFLGETAARRTQANISEIGKRISVSPAHRLKVIVSNGVSAYVIALVNITVLMLFLTEGIKGIDIGNRPGYAAVTCMMGCLIGVTFGILIESIGKWSQNIKTAILIGSSIFCAFLAGLMISSMKDIIEKHAPIVNRVNPAALIADSFYCICVYDDVERLQMNLVIMGVMSVLFLIVAWLMTRRVRYDSL